MGTNSLRCLASMYKFEEIRCTSRRPETRIAFAQKWSQALGIPVVPKDTIEEVVRGADIAVGGTTSGDIVSRESWLKPGATFISLARRELDPAGWSKLDKVVIDSWEFNMLQREFKRMVEGGLFSRKQLYGEIYELVSGAKRGASATTSAFSSTRPGLYRRTWRWHTSCIGVHATRASASGCRPHTEALRRAPIGKRTGARA